MRTKLDEIAAKARDNHGLRFTSLAHHVTPEFLRETWRTMNRRGAAGVDGETIREFEADIDERIASLHDRARRGRYRPPPVRRVDIPKGNGKTRPLGIPTVEENRGVPQGGPISPLLANVYLHYCLDLWVEKVVKARCKGQLELVRYADDFVVCFQLESDAKRFQAVLPRRMAKFGLKLAPAKTRRIVFGRFARERLGERGEKPREFVFLGFRHICGEDRRGRFAVIRLPSRAALRRFTDRVREWLWDHMHWKVRDHHKRLTAMLHGFYAYFALPHCGATLFGVHQQVMRRWRKLLMRRSQRSRTHWSYLKKQPWFQLPTPVSLHPMT